MKTTRKIAQFIYHTDVGNISAECRRIATRQILDGIGVAVAGSPEDAPRIIRTHLLKENGSGDCTVIGTDIKLKPKDAALANGVAAHVLDYDDIHPALAGHPTVVVLPTVLALAERGSLSGARILEGYILGVELACKLARIFNPAHFVLGWHATATLGTVGAAAAASKMIGLEPEQIQMALGLATSLAAGLKGNFGTMTKAYHAGMAAANGMEAALLIRHGYDAAPAMLDEGSNFFDCFTTDKTGLRPGELPEILGNPWALVEGMWTKKYPACGMVHASINAMLSLVDAHRPDPARIKDIEVELSPAASKNLNHNSAATGLEGKFSIEFCLASIAVFHKCDLSNFLDENVRNVQVQALQKKVRRRIRDAPLEFYNADIVVTMQDGTVYRDYADQDKGNPLDPLTDGEFLAKYRDCVTSVYDAKTAEATWPLIFDLGSRKNISDLMRYLGGNRK